MPTDATQPVVNARRARKARLIYVNDFETGLRRVRRGKGFGYISTRGRPLKSPGVLKRIKELAIPPAWTDVWICPKSNGHIQAIGQDEAGRRQYIYHPRWQALSSANKYDHMQVVAERLPAIRRRVTSDLDGRMLTRERVLAAVVRLIDKARIRVGQRRYAKANGSRGATTLTSAHVDVERFTISLDFPSKSGQRHVSEFRDKKVARVIAQCEDVEGQFLFCYQDERGDYQPVNSTDVNNYLQSIAEESITAKDFRTWWGSVIALSELLNLIKQSEDPRRSLRKIERAAVAETAKALGNTQAVCRNCYIHPGLIAAHRADELTGLARRARRGAKNGPKELSSKERLLATMLPNLTAS
jgi:DNA topoisomerase-1